MRRRRPPVIPEKSEQSQIVQLLRSLGAQVYVLGNHRRKGDFAGTMQTPGLPDLQAFMPRVPPAAAGSVPVCALCRHAMDGQGGMCSLGWCRCVCVPGAAIDARPVATYELVFVEVKASTGRLRPEQRELQTLCRQAGVAHIVGGYNAVVAWLLAEGYATPDQFPHYRLPAVKPAADTTL